jgi:hypothetical protein
MTLADVIRKLHQLSDDLAIYATPRWRPTSRAFSAQEPHDGSVPEHARGMTYLTTVGEAKRVIAQRREQRPDFASVDDLCLAIVYYAVYDETEPLASMTSGEINLPIAI